MELSKNIYTEPMSRMKRLAHIVFNEKAQESFHLSHQRDVGKSAVEAAGVQLVIEGLD